MDNTAKEAKINSLTINVLSGCPNCGTQNDLKFGEDEYGRDNSFCAPCAGCYLPFHITLPVQKVVGNIFENPELLTP